MNNNLNLITLLFCLGIFCITTGQTEEKDSISQRSINHIVIIDSNGAYYLKKGDGLALQATFKKSYGPKKEVFMDFLEDVPVLCSLAMDNLNTYRTDYGLGLIHCYNHYRSSERVIRLNQDYFDRFGLITLEEYRNGPAEKRLEEPKQIKGVVKQVIIVTNNYTNHVQTSSTTGEYYRFNFYYGDHYYKGGFALKNLKIAIGQDEEANKYIKQYRRRYFTRLSIIGVGFAQASLAIAWGVTGEAPFGMSTPLGITVLAPGVLFLNWNNLFPQKYKTRLINQTIDTYNRNLLL